MFAVVPPSHLRSASHHQACRKSEKHRRSRSRHLSPYHKPPREAFFPVFIPAGGFPAFPSSPSSPAEDELIFERPGAPLRVENSPVYHARPSSPSQNEDGSLIWSFDENGSLLDLFSAAQSQAPCEPSRDSSSSR